MCRSCYRNVRKRDHNKKNEGIRLTQVDLKGGVLDAPIPPTHPRPASTKILIIIKLDIKFPALSLTGETL